MKLEYPEKIWSSNSVANRSFWTYTLLRCKGIHLIPVFEFLMHTEFSAKFLDDQNQSGRLKIVTI